MQRRRRGFGADQVGGAGLGAGTAAGQKRKGCLGRLAGLGNYLPTWVGRYTAGTYRLPCGPWAPGHMGEAGPAGQQVAGGRRQVPAQVSSA